MGFFSEFLNTLSKNYPELSSNTEMTQGLESLVSEQIIEIPKSVLDRIDSAIKKIFLASRSENYIKKIESDLSAADLEILYAPVKNSSVLMGYDFHYDPQQDQISLIEINTNSSAFLIAELICQSDSGCKPIWGHAKSKLLQSFQNEASLSGRKLNRIAIIDDRPKDQKMYIEFIMFKEFFEQNEIQCEILDYQELRNIESYDLIYNRFNDFNLSNPESKNLRKSYLHNESVFSPNPAEYLRLADKARLQTLSDITKCDVFIPSIKLESESDWDQIWDIRKKYIFKPQRLYGAKAVYRGDSISRKKFDSLKGEKYLAQEYRAPDSLNNWKYDLRFFVYEDQIQLGVARLFQGQVLNFSNLGGGLARLKPRP